MDSICSLRRFFFLFSLLLAVCYLGHSIVIKLWENERMKRQFKQHTQRWHKDSESEWVENEKRPTENYIGSWLSIVIYIDSSEFACMHMKAIQTNVQFTAHSRFERRMHARLLSINKLKNAYFKFKSTNRQRNEMSKYHRYCAPMPIRNKNNIAVRNMELQKGTIHRKKELRERKLFRITCEKMRLHWRKQRDGYRKREIVSPNWAINAMNVALIFNTHISLLHKTQQYCLL